MCQDSVRDATMRPKSRLAHPSVPGHVSSIVVATVDLFPDHGNVSLRRVKLVGLPRKPEGWDLHLRLQLTCSLGASKPEVLGRVVILHGLPRGFPNHLESHSRGRRNRVQRRPARLIDYRDILHRELESIAIGADRQPSLRNRNHPVQPGRRYGRMEIVHLVCRDHRSPEQRESYVSEGSSLRCSAGPILSLHCAVVSRGTAKSDAISMIVGAHSAERAAAGDAAFEVIDMGRFEVWACRLVVAAIFVQPGDRIRIGATVRSRRLLDMHRVIPRWNGEWE